jgi:hypothetical protein
VRTIVDRKNGTDRTSKRHRAKIEPDRQRMAHEKRLQRLRTGLPKRAQAVVKAGEALLTEARGIRASRPK